MISEARALTNALTAAGVEFAYEEHSGGHVSVPRLSLPFLSVNLQGAELYIAPPRLALTLATNGLQLVFSTRTNVQYMVESSAALDTSGANWLERTRVTGNGQSATVQYPCQSQAQFFRVKPRMRHRPEVNP